MGESSLTTERGGKDRKRGDPQEPKPPSKIDIRSQLLYQDEFQFAYELLLPMVIIYH
jgi:hypothetical protein